MTLKIIADGSYNNQSGDGGFSFMVQVDGKANCIISGKLKDCIDCLDSELKAIANALYYCSKQKTFGKVKKITVYTDRADIESGKIKSKTKGKYNTPLSYINGFEKKVSIIKLKGHSTSTPEEVLHNIVDKLAVKARKGLI